MKKYIHLITLTLLYACCKDKPVEVLPEQNLTTIDLTFTDNFSHEPVKDLEITFIAFDDGPLNTMINIDTLGIYKTDANGKFYLEIKDLNKNRGHGVEWKKPSECYDEGSYALKVGVNNVYSRTLRSNATLRAHYKNVTPFDANDEMFFCWSYKRELSPYCFTSSPAGIGTSVDIVQTIPTSGNTKIYANWKSVKNSVIKIYIDSITTVPCSTNTVDIFY
jgi:hypothetical protein